MPPNEVTSPAPVTAAPTVPANRFGRSGILVLLVTLATAGAFGGVAYLIRDESASKDVLLPLMLIIGGVGLVWSIVLAIRAVANRESLLFPFLIALPIFWGLSVPLLQTWPETNRGTDDKWYFLHFFLFPLIIPQGVFALTMAAPPLLWFWRKTQIAEEAERPRLRRRTRKIFLAIATAVFVLLLPFGFYLYGGTMNRQAKFWTQSAVAEMPRWVGDVTFAALKGIPGSACERYAGEMVSRGLLSPRAMEEQIEAQILLVNRGNASYAFFAYDDHSPKDAMALARKLMSAPSGAKEHTIAKYFTERAHPEELHAFFKPERFSALNSDTKLGLMLGVASRRDVSDFINDIEMLMKANESVATQVSGDYFNAARFLACEAEDEVAKRMFLSVINLGARSTDRIIEALMFKKRFSVLLTGLQHNEAPKRHLVLYHILQFTKERSIRRNHSVVEVRFLFSNLLNSADDLDRILTALIVLRLTDELSERMAQKYFLADYGNIPPGPTRAQIQAAGHAENKALVERALEVLNR